MEKERRGGEDEKKKRKKERKKEREKGEMKERKEIVFIPLHVHTITCTRALTNKEGRKEKNDSLLCCITYLKLNDALNKHGCAS